MATCQTCGSKQLLCISGKHSDCCDAIEVNDQTKSMEGYAPYIDDICGGDYIEITFCMECGQIQGKFPVTQDWEDALRIHK